MHDSEQVVAAAVVSAGGRVLLVRRNVAEGTLLWTLPSGGVEPGETAEQAAARETLEETGLTVVPGVVVGERVHPTTGRHMVYVACDVVAGTARAAAPEEVAEVAWCGQARVAELVPGGLFGPVADYLNARLAA